MILGLLFTLPCRKPMAFKGGTSLSKVYHAIERFSEDIDVTVDYRSLIADAPPLDSLSGNQRKKLSAGLKKALFEYITQELVPALRRSLNDAFPAQEIAMEIGEDAEKVWIYYPSAVENTDAYLRPSIQLEFGGRNATLPQDLLTLKPDIAEHVTGLVLPVAHVAVLSPLRTFWEKATLIHVECHRPQLRPSAERLSRHWYDLARLADHAVGLEAISERELLKDVLQIKQTFFRSGFSNYEECAAGGLKLIPEASLLDALRQDYQAMIDAQMFYGDVLAFEQVIKRLAELEETINQAS